MKKWHATKNLETGLNIEKPALPVKNQSLGTAAGRTT
jgi:hypothetical protein